MVGYLVVRWRADAYDSIAWNIAEYLALFGIVLLHEFGHALACRSVGGRADTILLWPLGGVAYVNPPARPGALLWSVAAGPLVNVVLPVTIGAAFFVLGTGIGSDNVEHFVVVLAAINAILLVFNILPIYPLDGGQMVRAALWFAVGRERSLGIAASLGLIASVLGAALAWAWGDWWLLAIAVYAAWRSYQGTRVARVRAMLLALPRHPDAVCPSCGDSPPQGPFFRCPEQHPYDPFLTAGRCPESLAQLDAAPCVWCGTVASMSAWVDR